jgi:N-dimethylarginine dimethylaminohydrolase
MMAGPSPRPTATPATPETSEPPAPGTPRPAPAATGAPGSVAPGSRGAALVRPPGARFADAIVTHVERRPVDLGLAERQHAAYTAALEAAGWEIVALPPADELPDSVFVEDTMVVAGDLAVVTRPGAPSRRPEADAAKLAAQRLGLRVVRMEPPATLDGGDVLQTGDTVYVGRTPRTNDAGIDALARAFADHGPSRRVVPVAVRGCLHLKSAVTALPDGSLIGIPDLVDQSALPRLRVAAEPAGAHVVVLGPGHVLLAASAARTAERLTADGYDVTAVDISEFEAREGGVTCLSVLTVRPSPVAIRQRGRPG